MHGYWHHIAGINPAMRPCSGKILTNDMAMKQRLKRLEWQQTTETWVDAVTVAKKVQKQ